MKYTYLETAITAMSAKIADTFENFAYVANEKQHKPFPTYIQTTGDNTFMTVNSDRLKQGTKSETPKIPCMILRVGADGITYMEDEQTHEVENGTAVLSINGFETDYAMPMFPMPIEVRMTADVLFNNIFEFFYFVEYVLNGVYKRVPFTFMYMGKQQQGEIELETTDHTSEFDTASAFGTEQTAAHIEQLSFVAKMTYNSFRLNPTLGANVDDDGDGVNEGGIGGAECTELQKQTNKCKTLSDFATPSSNKIKGVVTFLDDTMVSNAVSRCDHGTVNDSIITKKLNNND